MAAAANSAHQKRTGPRGPVPSDVSRHHRPEATHRNGRQQRWPLQICKTCQIGYQIEIGPRFSIQFPFTGPKRYNVAHYHETIAFSSCKYYL